MSHGALFDFQVATCVEAIRTWLLTGTEAALESALYWSLDYANARDGRAIGVFSENFTFLQAVTKALTDQGFIAGELDFMGQSVNKVWFHCP